MLWLMIGISAADDRVASAQTPPGDEGSSVDVEASAGPHAEAKPRLQWRWKRVHPGEIASTALLAVGSIGFSQADTSVARWQATNRFDDWFRNRLKLEGNARDGVDLASRILPTLLFAYPLADSFGVVWIGDKNKDVFTQLLGVQAQALSMAAFMTYVAKATARRERPFGQEAECPGRSLDCGENLNKSFFSDSTSIAFAGAGLTCVTHRYLSLYGRVGDPLACGVTLTMASLTAFFRIMADEHWMTDVIAGTGIGLFAGWLMPWLLHFRHDETKPRGGAARVLRYSAPYGMPGGFGVRVAGRF